MNQYCLLNGEILPLKEAKVSVSDIGLLRGYGVYDGLAVIKGKVLHFSDHWQRFVRGAEALGLKVPISKSLLEEKILEIVDKSGVSERANVRLMLTGGETLEGIEYNFENPTFYALVGAWSSLPSEYFKTGAKLITHNYQREMPEIKTTNYIIAVNLQNLRKQQDAVEILYVHNGKVLECATSNIFLVKNKVLILPKGNVLGGITSKVVCQLVSTDYQIDQRAVGEEELKSADEVFITSSFKDVVPVSRVDDFAISNGEVGPVTRDIMDRFAKYIA